MGRKRAFHAVVEALRGDILAGRRQPGQRLPGEQELVEQFEVSRSVVREALRVLEAQGLVEIRHGYHGGAFVATDALAPLLAAMQMSLQLGQLDVGALYEARLMLEPVLARLAAERATQSAVEQLRAKHTEIAELADTGGDPFVANLEFHALVATAGGNQALSLLMEALFGLLESTHGQYPPTAAVHRQAIADHERLVAAIAAGDTTSAEQAMTAHLQALESRLREIDRALQRS